MNAIDSILNGTEPIVQMIAEDMGILAAEDFMTLFNNSCLQVAGLEDAVCEVLRAKPFTLAPITNMSMTEH